jgi:hypothetical protein
MSIKNSDMPETLSLLTFEAMIKNIATKIKIANSNFLKIE